MDKMDSLEVDEVQGEAAAILASPAAWRVGSPSPVTRSLCVTESLYPESAGQFGAVTHEETHAEVGGFRRSS